MEHDPELGWRKVPGAQARFSMREYDVEVRVNSHGMRDVERSYERPVGTRRILAVGDSFVEGLGVAGEEVFTRVLERSLAARGMPVEVLNGGTSGYGTDQELLFYRSQGRRYRPDVVALLVFPGNDLDENGGTAGGRKPRFALEEGGLRLENVPVPPPARRAPAPVEVRGDAPLSPSALVDWVGRRLLRGSPRAYDLGVRLRLWPRQALVMRRQDTKIYLCDRRNPEVESAWQVTEALLRAFAGEVAADGARLVLVHVPNRIEVDPRAWEASVGRFAWEPGRLCPGVLSARLHEVAGRVGVEVLDLSEPLRQAQGRWASAYYAEDTHWNARGHAVAARELERFLLDRGWLRGEPSVREEESKGSPR